MLRKWCPEHAKWSKMLPKWSQNDSTMLPPPSPGMVFKHAWRNACTCTCTCTSHRHNARWGLGTVAVFGAHATIVYIYIYTCIGKYRKALRVMEPTRQNIFAKFAKCGTEVVRVAPVPETLGNQKNTPKILKKSTQNRSKMVPGPPWAPKVRDRGGMSGTEPPQGLIFEAPGPHLDAPRGPLGTLVAPQCALLGARGSQKRA